MDCKSGINSARGRIFLWTPSCHLHFHTFLGTSDEKYCQMCLPADGVLNEELVHAVSWSLYNSWVPKKRGEKKKKQRKEEKRKHNLACVKKQSAESAENLSTPCLVLVLSSCSPSPTKGIRHCPPLKHTLLLFRTTFFLKGSHQIVEQKRQCGAHSHTLWDYKYQTWFDLNERWVCILPLLPHSLNQKNKSVRLFWELMSQKMKQEHFWLHIENLYLKKMTVRTRHPLLHLGRISSLHHVNHVKDLKKKPHHTQQLALTDF